MTHRKGPSHSPPAGFSLLELLVAVFVAVNLIALLGCAMQGGGAGARTMDTNNLKQIAIAMHNYHDTFKCLPYNGTRDVYESKLGKRGGNANTTVQGAGSYAYGLLPYIEQQSLWQSQTGTGSGPHAQVYILISPTRARPGVANVGYQGPQTDYHVNPYLNRPDLLNGNQGDPDACSREDELRKLTDITDGTSNTIFAGHAFFNTRDYTVQDGTNPLFASVFRGGEQCSCRVAPGSSNLDFRKDDTGSPTSGWGSPYPQGAMFTLVDATVRMIPYGTNLAPFFDPDDGVAVLLPD